MTLADHALASFFALGGTVGLAFVALASFRRRNIALRPPRLKQRVASHRPHLRAGAADAAYPPGSLTPSARHRDEMIRQGLLS